MPGNNPDQFERIVRPQMKLLFGAAFRLTGNEADAADLVQEVCIKANTHLEQLAGIDYPDRWLRRVLYNCFVDSSRKRERSPIAATGAEPVSPAMASNAANPEVLAGQANDEERIDQAWQLLEPDQQALLALRAEGYDLAAIAEITGLAKNVLGPRLHRARLSLKRHLETLSDDVESSTQRRSSR